MTIGDFHLLRPAWLLCAPLGALLAWIWWRSQIRVSPWRRVCDPDLLPRLLVSRGPRASQWPYLLVGIGWALAAVALAGPAWDRLAQPTYRNLAGRVIVLDVSTSMDAADLTPSRLVLARFKVADILDQPYDGQYALVVFAGDAFTVSPLTDDVATLRNLLPALDTQVVPVQGSRADLGLAHAGRLLEQVSSRGGEIILVADEAGSRARTVATELAEKGIVVHVLAVGTETGGPIPQAEGGFLKDAGGAIVLPAVDTVGLRRVAGAGGGVYQSITVDDSDVLHLVAAMDDGMFTDSTGESPFATERWNDRGPWLVLLVLPFAALGFRRGWLILLLVAAWAPPEPAAAGSWEQMWWRQDQAAARAFIDQDMARAGTYDQAPDWQGAAQYRSGEYATAERSFARAEDVAGHYNRGNALAREGRLEEALAAYDAALAEDPAHEDAIHNRDIVESALQQQPPQDSQNRSGDSSEQEESGQQEGSGEQQESEESSESAEGQDAPSDRAPPQSDSSAATDGESGDDEEPQAEQTPTGAPASEGDDNDGTREERSLAQNEDPGDSPPLPDEARVDQWLRRIPDDPGGLLRRKFRLQYQRREDQPAASEQTW